MSSEISETIRKLYCKLEVELNASEISGKLLSNGLIGTFLQEDIACKPHKVDKNRLLLDHLQLFDEKHLRKFCDVLSTCNPPKGLQLAQLISDTLDEEKGK